MTSSCPYGFRIDGNCGGERRLVDWRRAFGAYCTCDRRAAVDHEAYLSAFTFGAEFRELLERTGSPRGFSGACWALWLWFDIDSDSDLEAATRDARRLCGALVDRYRLDGDELLIFFSGAKGFHVGLPTSLWQPAPSSDFHRVAKRFAGDLAATAKATIDASVFDRVRAFRAPNSRHAKSGLHKRRLEFDELLYVTTTAIVERAANPEPFDIPEAPALCQAAVDDWQRAALAVKQETEAASQRRQAIGGATLNRATLEFIRDGADVGDRHRMLYSAAANLAEFGCPAALAHALLTEAALDCGLAPTEVRRQIECGLSSGPTAGSAAG